MAHVSLIIPAYNREAYLAEALASAMGQTRPPDEIIVIDDGSTDRTAEVARSFHPSVRCVSQDNQGIGAARNAGLKIARGDFFAFLDSDDLWLERKLELQLGWLETHPETGLIFCHARPFLSPELAPGSVPAFDDREMPALLSSCLVARRSAFDRVGLFTTDPRGGEFIDWCGRAQEENILFDVLPELLVRRRVHATNSVRDRRRRNSGYTHVLKRQLDRRRAAKG